MKNDIVHGKYTYKCVINYGDIKFVRYGGVHRTGLFWIRFCTSDEKDYIEIDSKHIGITSDSSIYSSIYCDSSFKALEYMLPGKK